MRLCERIVVTLLGPDTRLSTGIPTARTTPGPTGSSRRLADAPTMSGH
jgi:hypothetical protein